MKKVALFVTVFIFNIVIAFIAKQYDTYPEHFSYRFQLYNYNSYIPSFLIAFANYDGAHYLRLAHDGYQNFEQSFFPLFPLIISFLAKFSGLYFLPGFFLANICFGLGFYIFQKYLKLFLKKETIIWTLLFLLVFPTSFFFNAVYTEGLFFLLVLSSFYFMKTKKYLLVVLVSFLAGLTRLVGVFLVIPLIISLIAENRQFLTRTIYRHPFWILIIISPILGLLTYMAYLYFFFHDPFAFYHASYVFGEQRSTHIIFLPQVYYRYLSIFLTAQHSFIYYIAVLEFIIFNFVLAVLCYDFARLWKSRKTRDVSLFGLNLFSFANLLVPTLAGSLSSMPRYALLSLSFFVRLGQIKNKKIKIGLCTIFAVLHGLLLWLFIQGYFIS